MRAVSALPRKPDKYAPACRLTPRETILYALSKQLTEYYAAPPVRRQRRVSTGGASPRARYGTSRVTYAPAWNVRASTSSCCSLVSFTKFTA